MNQMKKKQTLTILTAQAVGVVLNEKGFRFRHRNEDTKKNGFVSHADIRPPRMVVDTTLYDLLGVPPRASECELKEIGLCISQSDFIPSGYQEGISQEGMFHLQAVNCRN